MMDILLPGSTIGILGNGQLGRMLALAARRMGYQSHCYGPEAGSPAGQVADRESIAPFGDLECLQRFAQSVDVVTFEFENVPAVVTETIMSIVPVRPTPAVLHISQHRLREKTFLRTSGFPVAPFAAVSSGSGLSEAVRQIGYPCLAKTIGFGYDGKGQMPIHCADDLIKAQAVFGQQPAIIEGWVRFDRELSVVGARAMDGTFTHFAVTENIHHKGILEVSLAPARVEQDVQDVAVQLTRQIFEALEVVGVACVEFFLTHEHQLLVNELAPRPHNSGHWTIEGAATSQFEQQLRAVCGLPLGSTNQLAPTAMLNLLGDLWQTGEPPWEAVLALPSLALHLYGKRAARPGRKMGHVTVLGTTVEQAWERIQQARSLLGADRHISSS
ncbi:MAG: 5-(carboxyamino)imidazole ribonucleotide synthase [Herpetosiphon sp.]